MQQQMDEFRIRPSAAVWQKVEEELRKKKKRRVVVYIFLLAGLGLLGSLSTYFFSHTSKQNLVHQNAILPNTTNTGNDKSLKINNDKPVKKETTGNRPSSEEQEPLFVEKKNTPAEIDGMGSTEKKIASDERDVVKKEKVKASKKIVAKRLPVETKKKNIDDAAIVSARNRKNTLKQKKESELPTISNDGIPDLSVDEKKVDQKRLKEENNIPGDTATKANDTPVTDIPVTADSLKEELAIAQEETKVIGKGKKLLPKINWGIELSGGISSNHENIFSLADNQKSLSADFFSAPITNAISARPAVIYLPSSIQPGPAFRVGVVAEMKLSKKSSISSGLRYAYSSNNIKVGTYKDTTVAFSSTYSQAVNAAAIYGGFQQKEFINRFHFIQIPLQYQLQLNKGIKLPIIWNAGVAAGYLFSTNALVYNPASSGIYYHDKTAFNKFHLNLNTGFLFKLGSKNKMKWSLGPELSLAMNKLTKEDNRNQYLLYGGITGRIMFTKKK